MAIYIILYLFIILVYWLTSRFVLQVGGSNKICIHNKSKITLKNDKWFVILSISAIILVMGLRSKEMGIDLRGYLPSFEMISRLSWKEVLRLDSFYNYEKGYIILNKLLSTLSQDSQILIFFCAFASIAPVGYLIYKNSKNMLLSIITYLGLPVFLITFSGLRQAIAIGITLIAYQYLVQKKLIPFVLFVLFASLFHSSALAFLIAYPLYYLKISRFISWISIIMLGFIFVFRYPLFNLFIKIFKLSVNPDYNEAVNLFIIFTFIYTFCLLFGDTQNEKTNGLMNLFWVACAAQALAGVNSIVMRVGYYFFIYLTILLPEITERVIPVTDLEKNKYNLILRKNRKLITLCIFVCFLVFGLYSLRNASWAQSYPYTFFLECRLFFLRG